MSKYFTFNTDLYRALVLTILAGLAAVTVAMANRNVYTKEQVNQLIDAQEQVQTVQLNVVEDDIAEIKDDVKWIVRHLGGDINVESE